MAQKTTCPPHTDLADHRPRSFTREERRTAFLRHAELLAAEEGRGEAFGSDARSARVRAAADGAALDAVTDRLLASDRREGFAHRNRVLDYAKTGVEAVFRAVKADASATQYDLESRRDECLARMHLAPTDDERDALAVELESDEDVLALRQKGGPGPADVAKKAFAKAVGLSTGTLDEARRRTGTPFRQSGRRWIGIRVLLTFISELISEVECAPRSLPLSALRKFDSTTSRCMDAAVWAQMRELAGDASLLAYVVQSEDVSAEWSGIREQLRSRIETDCGIALLVGVYQSFAFVTPTEAESALFARIFPPEFVQMLIETVPTHASEWTAALLLAMRRAGVPLGGEEDVSVDELEDLLRWAVTKRVTEEVSSYWTRKFNEAEADGRV